MKLVYIQWKDHSSRQGGVWHARDDVESLKPITIASVGWVMKETKKHITIAAHISPHQSGGDMCILKGCIREMKVLQDE